MEGLPRLGKRMDSPSKPPSFPRPYRRISHETPEQAETTEINNGVHAHLCETTDITDEINCHGSRTKKTPPIDKHGQPQKDIKHRGRLTTPDNQLNHLDHFDHPDQHLAPRPPCSPPSPNAP